MKNSILVVLLFALTACVGSKPVVTVEPLEPKLDAEVQYVTSNDLEDPNAAVFRELKKITTEYPDGRATIQICGRMNSADPAGGYQGFRDFYGFIEKGRFRLSGIAPLADPRIYRDICKG